MVDRCGDPGGESEQKGGGTGGSGISPIGTPCLVAKVCKKENSHSGYFQMLAN